MLGKLGESVPVPPPPRPGARHEIKIDYLKPRNKRTWLCPRLVRVIEMGFAIVADARAVRRIHDGAVGADDIHDAPVVQRARPHFVWLQALGIARGDVAPQSLRGRRTELGRDARLRMFQERKDRRCALEGVACRDKQKKGGGPRINKNKTPFPGNSENGGREPRRGGQFCYL
jgi:hypothetical protein